MQIEKEPADHAPDSNGVSSIAHSPHPASPGSQRRSGPTGRPSGALSVTPQLSCLHKHQNNWRHVITQIPGSHLTAPGSAGGAQELAFLIGSQVKLMLLCRNPL